MGGFAAAAAAGADIIFCLLFPRADKRRRDAQFVRQNKKKPRKESVFVLFSNARPLMTAMYKKKKPNRLKLNSRLTVPIVAPTDLVAAPETLGFQTRLLSQ